MPVSTDLRNPPTLLVCAGFWSGQRSPKVRDNSANNADIQRSNCSLHSRRTCYLAVVRFRGCSWRRMPQTPLCAESLTQRLKCCFCPHQIGGQTIWHRKIAKCRAADQALRLAHNILNAPVSPSYLYRKAAFNIAMAAIGGKRSIFNFATHPDDVGIDLQFQKRADRIGPRGDFHTSGFVFLPPGK